MLERHHNDKASVMAKLHAVDQELQQAIAEHQSEASQVDDASRSFNSKQPIAAVCLTQRRPGRSAHRL